MRGMRVVSSWIVFVALIATDAVLVAMERGSLLRRSGARWRTRFPAAIPMLLLMLLLLLVVC